MPFLPTPTARPEAHMRVLASICVALLGAFAACSDSTLTDEPVAVARPAFAEAFTSNETVPFEMFIEQP